MIKSLVVAYDGSQGAGIALQHAVDVAKRSEGRITLLTVSRTADNEAAALYEPIVDPAALASEPSHPDSEPAVEWDTDAVLGDAVELCRKLTVRCVARPAHGDLAAALLRASRFADLVFIGRDALAQPALPGRSARSARSVAAQAWCPVVVTPRQYQPVRSVVAACLIERPLASTVRTGSELAHLLQVKLETLLVGSDDERALPVARSLKRYLGDHGHSPEVIVRRPPARDALVAVIADRSSPLVIVPRSGWATRLLRRDTLSAALEILNATIIVVP